MARRTRRPELVELIPELEEVRRGTEALEALEAERVVGPLLIFVESEAAEKECLSTEKTVSRLTCRGRRCDSRVLGHTCAIRTFRICGMRALTGADKRADEAAEASEAGESGRGRGWVGMAGIGLCVFGTNHIK